MKASDEEALSARLAFIEVFNIQTIFSYQNNCMHSSAQTAVDNWAWISCLSLKKH